MSDWYRSTIDPNASRSPPRLRSTSSTSLSNSFSKVVLILTLSVVQRGQKVTKKPNRPQKTGLRSRQRFPLHFRGKPPHRNLLAQVQHIIKIMHHLHFGGHLYHVALDRRNQRLDLITA